MDIKKTIGTRIQEVRNDHSMTGDIFGEIIGMSRAGVSAIEKGKNFPSIDSILKLVEHFNLNVNWLLTGEEPKYSPATTHAETDLFKLSHHGTHKESDISSATLNELINKRIDSALRERFTYVSTDAETDIIKHVHHNTGEESDISSAIISHSTDQARRSTLQEVFSNILLVDSKSQDLYPSHYKDPYFLEGLHSFSIPHKKFSEGEFRAFEAVKKLKALSIIKGSILIGRREAISQDIKPTIGTSYVFVTKAGIKISRIKRWLGGDNLIDLEPEDFGIGDEIVSHEILEIWSIQAILNFEFGEYVTYDEFEETKKEIAETRKELADIRVGFKSMTDYWKTVKVGSKKPSPGEKEKSRRSRKDEETGKQ